jgi:hypothetical protein
MTTTRRPAAIMAVDVGGYSEDGVAARVHEHLCVPLRTDMIPAWRKHSP